VWSGRDRKPIRKTLPTLAAALAWRQESQVALRRGTMRAPTPVTVRQAAEEWLLAAEAGIIRTRSGDPYKPSALRAYRQALRKRVLPQIGSQRLSAVTRNQLQDLLDRLVAKGLAPSTVRNSILPLRAIYRRALQRDEIAANPTLKLSLPAVRGRRDQIADPHHAAALIAALPESDQALWATALYAGLRRGELQALNWHDIDLQASLIHVNGSWDMRAGPISPKSRAGRRRVPLITTLRRHLVAHQLRQGRPDNGYVFPNRHGRPFDPTTIVNRARKTWNHNNLKPLTLHECRHSYAAFMIAAGVNAKALSTYMGHSTITTTLDRYGHLLPGNETHAANLLETLLTTEQAVS
jgi:integrase